MHLIGSDVPQFRVGLGGNHYAWCAKKEPMLDIAKRIGRRPSAVYWRDDFKVWVIRSRDPKQKLLLKALFDKLGGQMSLHFA